MYQHAGYAGNVVARMAFARPASASASPSAPKLRRVRAMRGPAASECVGRPRRPRREWPAQGRTHGAWCTRGRVVRDEAVAGDGPCDPCRTASTARGARCREHCSGGPRDSAIRLRRDMPFPAAWLVHLAHSAPPAARMGRTSARNTQNSNREHQNVPPTRPRRGPRQDRSKCRTPRSAPVRSRPAVRAPWRAPRALRAWPRLRGASVCAGRPAALRQAVAASPLS